MTHPEYELWKDLSERDNENWEAVQKSFLKRSQAQKPKHENRFKTNHVQGGQGQGQGGQRRGRRLLSKEQYAAYLKAVEDGTSKLQTEIFQNLSPNKLKKLKDAREKKKKSNDGSLGTQYQIQHGNLQPGTILAPVDPQDGTVTPSHSNMTPTPLMH